MDFVYDEGRGVIVSADSCGRLWVLVKHEQVEHTQFPHDVDGLTAAAASLERLAGEAAAAGQALRRQAEALRCRTQA